MKEAIVLLLVLLQNSGLTKPWTKYFPPQHEKADILQPRPCYLKHEGAITPLFLLPDGHCQQWINYPAIVMTTRKSGDALWGRQSPRDVEGRGPQGNDLVTLTTSEIPQFCLANCSWQTCAERSDVRAEACSVIYSQSACSFAAGIMYDLTY